MARLRFAKALIGDVAGIRFRFFPIFRFQEFQLLLYSSLCFFSVFCFRILVEKGKQEIKFKEILAVGYEFEFVGRTVRMRDWLIKLSLVLS